MRSEGGPDPLGLHPSEEEVRTQALTEGRPPRTQGEDGVHRPRRGSRSQPCSPLGLGLQPQAWERGSVCGLSLSVCGVFLWLPEQTKTLSIGSFCPQTSKCQSSGDLVLCSRNLSRRLSSASQRSRLLFTHYPSPHGNPCRVQILQTCPAAPRCVRTSSYLSQNLQRPGNGAPWSCRRECVSHIPRSEAMCVSGLGCGGL